MQSARELRARTYHRIREFFLQRKVMEVETPILSLAANTDPNIDSFQAADPLGPLRFLRTSPEFPMKRLLAAGSGAIYELGRVFRQAEQGARHNPEFTLLEWYRPGFDHHQLMDEVEALLQAVGAIKQAGTAKRFRYRDLVQMQLNIDPLAASDQQLNELVNARGWFDGPLGRSACLDLIISLGVVPGFASGELVFIHDFPACQAALAETKHLATGDLVSDRFELYVGGIEIANAYQELGDGQELARRFAANNKQRQLSGKPIIKDDPELLAVIDDLPRCAGIALGIDRLTMALRGLKDIAGV